MGKLAAPVRADKEMMFTNRQLVALKIGRAHV